MMLIDAFRCTALPENLDAPALRRTPIHTDLLIELLDTKTLWTEYGIDDDIIVSSLPMYTAPIPLKPSGSLSHLTSPVPTYMR